MGRAVAKPIITVNAMGFTAFYPSYALKLHVNEHEVAYRLEKWKQPAPRYTRGVLAKYAKLVSSASLGAVTDNLD